MSSSPALFEFRSCGGRLLLLLLALGLPPHLVARDPADAALRYSLTAPGDATAPGSSVTLELTITNVLARDAAATLPAAYTGMIVDGPHRSPAELRVLAGTAELTVPARSFVIVPLGLTVPTDVSGEMELTMEVPARLRVGLDVTAPASSASRKPGSTESQEASSTPAGEPARPLAIAHLTRYYAGSFEVYEPMYFIHGARAPAAKFQFSFRYRLVAEDGWLAHRFPYLEGLTFAYTQRSLWDLRGESSPFYDTSYMPEIGYMFLAREPAERGLLTLLGWQVAAQHESNGKMGPDSRSLNNVFFRAAFAVGDLDGWHLVVSPRLQAYFNTSVENADIADYRGHGELRVVFGRNDGPALSVTAHAGRSFHRGATQLDLTIPTHIFSSSISSFLHVQYWNGYGESLRGYNQHTEALRAGISLVR